MLPEEVAHFYFSQTVKTLKYIADKDISHRDIKLENMLITTDYNLKIADFGFASLQTADLT